MGRHYTHKHIDPQIVEALHSFRFRAVRVVASSVVESSKRLDTSRRIVEPRSFALDEFSIDDGSHFRMYGKMLKKEGNTSSARFGYCVPLG